MSKIKMLLNWKGNELNFTVGRIDLPKNIKVTHPYNGLFPVLEVGEYITLKQPNLFLDQDYMSKNFFYMWTNQYARFFIKNNKNNKKISDWFEKCFATDIPHLKQDVVASGILKSKDGIEKRIENAYITMYDADIDCFIIEADF